MSLGWMPFFFMSLDQEVVDPLQAGRAGLQDLGDVVARAVDVGIAEHQDRLASAGCGPGGRLASRTVTHVPSVPDQRPGDVEAVLGQQVVEVVARDAAGRSSG